MKTKEDVEKAVHGTLLHDSRLYESLVRALEARRNYEAEPDPSGVAHGANARRLLRLAIEVIHDLVGEDALAEAYGEDPPADAPREEHLLALWWRLHHGYDLFSHVEEYGAKSSLLALSEEILSIMNGDAADLLAELPRQQNRALNAWRLAQRKMAALEWEIFLRGQGYSIADAQSAVCEAFGPGVQWTTIKRWKDSIVQHLGQDNFDKGIEAANLGVSRFSRASKFKSAEANSEALARDGEEYRQEQRRRVRLVK